MTNSHIPAGRREKKKKDKGGFEKEILSEEKRITIKYDRHIAEKQTQNEEKNF